MITAVTSVIRSLSGQRPIATTLSEVIQSRENSDHKSQPECCSFRFELAQHRSRQSDSDGSLRNSCSKRAVYAVSSSGVAGLSGSNQSGLNSIR